MKFTSHSVTLRQNKVRMRDISHIVRMAVVWSVLKSLITASTTDIDMQYAAKPHGCQHSWWHQHAVCCQASWLPAQQASTCRVLPSLIAASTGDIDFVYTKKHARCCYLVHAAEDRLLAAVVASSHHVLHSLFSPTIVRRPGLRPRPHDFILPLKNDSNFISRVLHRSLQLHSTNKLLVIGYYFLITFLFWHLCFFCKQVAVWQLLFLN